MKAEGKMAVARTNLVLEQPFFGFLALRLEVVAATRIVSGGKSMPVKTMATDGVHLFYNPEFVDQLSMEQAEGIICHEVMHCAMGHPWRRDGRDQVKFNKACDYAINPIILSAGMKLTEGALVDQKFDNMHAEKIYGLILDEPQGNKGGKGKGKGKGQQSPGQGEAEDGEGEEYDIDVLDGESQDAGEQEAEWKMATIAAVKAAQSQGKLPAQLERLVGEVVRPKTDWRSLLRRFVQETAKNDYTWKMPSHRYLSMGLYMPSLRSEQMPPIVVCVDTSGSIGQVEITAFEAEIRSIVAECNPSELDVMYIDAAVARVDKFYQGDEIVIKPAGGGGTDFRPAFTWVDKQEREPVCLIYLTDLYGSFPDRAPGYPVLWLATSDQVAPFGETIRMDM